MSEALALLPEGQHLSGLLDHLEQDANGQFRAVTIATEDGRFHVPFDHPDLAREANQELAAYFDRHPESTQPGITVAHDVPGAARIGDLDPEDSCEVAWVFVIRWEGPRFEGKPVEALPFVEIPEEDRLV